VVHGGAGVAGSSCWRRDCGDGAASFGVVMTRVTKMADYRHRKRRRGSRDAIEMVVRG